MFNPNSDQKVDELVQLELDQAIKQWGEKYHSINIADMVLEEEIEEAKAEVKGVQNTYVLWLEKLAGKTDIQADVIEVIEKCAKNGIKELAQVCAVCEKIKKSF